MSASLDKNGSQIKWGIIHGEDNCKWRSLPMAASAIIPAGGCFVSDDGSGRGVVAGDGTTLLLGYVLPGEVGLDAGKKYQTCSSVAGATIVPFVPINQMLGVVVRLPINTGTYVSTFKGKTCDLIQNNTTKAQGLQLDASTEDTVEILAGDSSSNNAWADVTPYIPKITGVAGVV